jgi:cobalt-zinc-cadmium efflux system outer membrane protein
MTAWQLRGRVRTALISLWSAEQTIALARHELSVVRRYQAVVRERFRAGMVSAAAVTTATLSKERAQLAVATEQRRLRLAHTRLAATLGVPATALREVRLDWRGISAPRRPGNLRPLIHAALNRRPDVLAALARYQAAEDTLRLAIARQYPSFAIGPGYHYDQGDNKFILGVSLPLPILNQNQGAIAQARAARREAALQFEATQARVLAEIARARTDWRASAAELAAARRVMASAADVLAQRRSAFDVGEIGRLRLLSAEEMLIVADQGALMASVQERRALGHLESALFHPFLIAARAH